MKKYLTYALSAIFALNLFAACGGSNDDDEPKPEVESWKGISKTYQKTDDFSALTLNGVTVVIGADGRSVELKASSATAANIILNNLLPDNPALSIPLTMSESQNLNSFAIQGEANGVKVSGEVSYQNIAATQLSLDITRAVASPVTGNWKLAMTTAGEQTTAGVYIDAQTGDATTDFMLNAFKPVLGSMIGGKVSEVNVLLKEDGTFDVNWVNQGETEPTGMPAAIAAMVKIHYFATDKILMLALDKALFSESGSINMVAILNSLLAEKGIQLDVNTLLGLMTDLGGYYGFPLNYTAVDGGTAFYVDKAILAAMTPVFSPLLASVVPENMLPVLQGILESIPASEKFDFGLILAK